MSKKLNLLQSFITGYKEDYSVYPSISDLQYLLGISGTEARKALDKYAN